MTLYSKLLSTRLEILLINCFPLSQVFIFIGSLPRVSRGIRITEDNNTITYYDVLRGRDGLPGRDGEKGEQGEPGIAGESGPPGLRGPVSSGVLYTRWGKSSCPDIAGTELLYAGRTGGTLFHKEGGGANYQCMPESAEYDPSLRYGPDIQYDATLYAAAYKNPLQGTQDHNVPCAVCYVATREVVVMIPAKASCPPSWTREYYGYLMSGNTGDSDYIRGRTMFECVDKDQESVPGSDQLGAYGALFYHVEASCYGMPCPPYNEHQELNCVVCTK